MNFAVDRRTAARLFGGPARTQMSCQILPSGMAGYRPYCPYTLGGGPGYRGPDPDRARRLVSASHTAGQTVSVAGDPQNKAFSELFVRTLRALHYRTTLKIFSDSGTYYRTIGSPGSRWQIGFYGWVQDYPAPADFLDVAIGCGSPFDRRTSAMRPSRRLFIGRFSFRAQTRPRPACNGLGSTGW
jgi:peptide/nickel transport system substrate-binding protein